MIVVSNRPSICLNCKNCYSFEPDVCAMCGHKSFGETHHTNYLAMNQQPDKQEAKGLPEQLKKKIDAEANIRFPPLNTYYSPMARALRETKNIQFKAGAEYMYSLMVENAICFAEWLADNYTQKSYGRWQRNNTLFEFETFELFNKYQEEKK